MDDDLREALDRIERKVDDLRTQVFGLEEFVEELKVTEIEVHIDDGSTTWQ